MQGHSLSAGRIELYAQKHESAVPVTNMIWLGAVIYTLFHKLVARNFIQTRFVSLRRSRTALYCAKRCRRAGSECIP